MVYQVCSCGFSTLVQRAGEGCRRSWDSRNVDCREEVDGVDNDGCRVESGVEAIVGGLLERCRRWRMVVGVESERMGDSDKILSVVGSQAT